MSNDTKLIRKKIKYESNIALNKSIERFLITYCLKSKASMNSKPMAVNLSKNRIKSDPISVQAYECKNIEQADELKFLIKKKICNINNIQHELRQAIIAGEYKKSSVLMGLLEKAQVELEMVYIT